MSSARVLAPLALGLTLLLTGGCIEIPEFEFIPVPNNLGEALGATPDNCSPGTFECACRPDQSCHGGLACVEGLCEAPGDGDGDPTGDGDGEPTGDGDGEPTGDGDGEPTGDGDGDPTGDGDGDPNQACVDDSDCPYAHACAEQACVLLANYAFVTSQTFAPDFGGLAGGDALCQAAADQAGLDGTYLALLSDETMVNPSARLEGYSGWVRTDLRNFANDPDEMVASSEIYYPLTFDEFGNDLGAVLVYTGGVEGYEHCDNWTSTDPMGIAGLGYTGSGSWEWLFWNYASCSGASAHLYCFGYDNNWSDTPPLPPSYRRAFLSYTWVSGNVGIAAMDQLCQDEATAAGLVTNDEVFTAWIAHDQGSPNQDLDLGGPPWVRTDDVSIVELAANLDDPSSYLAPLTVHADGSRGGGSVWTGTSNPTVPGDLETTCDGWVQAEAEGNIGYASLVDAQFGTDLQFCWNALPIYCLQQ
jgi:hypothetical protein